MPTKFYFHDATTTVGGTLPAAGTFDLGAPDVTAAGAGTNRSMDATIGVAQTSAALTTLAIATIQSNVFRRFISPLIAAQTIAAQVITCRLAASESNTSSDMFEGFMGGLYLWRPGTGAKVGSTITWGIGTEPGTTQTAVSGTRTGVGTLTALDGDVLVYELWSQQTQSMAVGYTNTVFYDGTTEGSTTSNAAHIEFTNNVTLFTPSAIQTREPWPALQAVNTASVW